jgi:hypothetical protein
MRAMASRGTSDDTDDDSERTDDKERIVKLVTCMDVHSTLLDVCDSARETSRVVDQKWHCCVMMRATRRTHAGRGGRIAGGSP